MAARLGLSPSCVIKWMARFRKTGGVKLGKIGGHVTPKIRGTHRDWVLQQIDAGGDVTPQGLADGTAERDLKADNRTVRNFVHSTAKRFKKPCTVLSRTASPSPGGDTGVLSRVLCAGPVDIKWPMKRSPKIAANWARAVSAVYALQLPTSSAVN